jgi:hypothetical protein
MPLTFTGRRIRPGGVEHPSLLDIAVGLSRMPRFAGQTKHWFSVLDHSLFCHELLSQDRPDAPRVDQLAVLLHDAHESMTGDIPTDWKGSEIKRNQVDLDLGIMDAFFPGGWSSYECLKDTVRYYDRLALIAEAHLIGPPVEPAVILASFGAAETTHDDVQLLRDLKDEPWFMQTPWPSMQVEHFGVKEYLHRITELM